MLRILRISFAAAFFTAVTFLFLDFTGLAREFFAWTAKVQFIPALFAANFAVVAALAILTLIFGRIYCSVICPLGVLQDIISNLVGRKKRNRFAYTPAKTFLRVLFLILFCAAAIFGFASAASLIAPYSAFGRIASNFFAPVWIFGNNILANIADVFDLYVFDYADIWFRGMGVFLVALVTFAGIIHLSIKGGRTYCNTICPVGTVLGFISKFSIFKIRIDTSKCNSCGLCARNCKSGCINPKEHKIDYSRCVDCFDCIGKCRQSAISYSAKSKAAFAKKSESSKFVNAQKYSASALRRGVKQSANRRGFFLAVWLLIFGATNATAAEKTVDGGRTPIKERKRPERKRSIVPAGAQSPEYLADKCTGCQLCVSACPSNILLPSSKIANFMQPEMSFERGYCKIECTECSKVCPAGAITPVELAQKASTQIGRAVWFAQRCIVNTDGVQCDNCFVHCPTGAIQMVAKNPKDKKSPKIPTIDEARCIGCGACENLCPARPLAAICVEGNSVHTQI